MASNARREENLENGWDTVNFPSAKAAKEYRNKEDTKETKIETISYTSYNPKQDPRIDWTSPRGVTETAIGSAKNENIKAAKIILETYAEDCEHRELQSVIQTLQKNWGENSEWTDQMRELERHVKEVYNAETDLEKHSAKVRV